MLKMEGGLEPLPGPMGKKDTDQQLKSVADSWDMNAEAWAKQLPQGFDIFREHFNNPAFMKFCGDLKGKKVLDAGCGEGRNTRLFAQTGARMYGADLSEMMIGFARDEEKKRPLGIRYELASFTDLGIFEEGFFDAVVSTMALMDSPDFSESAREIYRVLTRGGQFIFSITHPCFMTKGLEWILDERGAPRKLAVSDYFDREPYEEQWKFSGTPPEDESAPFNITYYPRTISSYINTLLETGFELKGILEPRPTEQACAEFGQFRRWRDHACLFLYIKAIK